MIQLRREGFSNAKPLRMSAFADSLKPTEVDFGCVAAIRNCSVFLRGCLIDATDTQSCGVHTKMRIEPYNNSQLDAVTSLSLRAWSPVFDSIQKAMDFDVYQAFYPDDWRVSQLHAVEEVCAATDTKVWVAIDSGAIMGFVAVKLHPKTNMGEIYMLAVDPDYQRRGIGTALAEFALDQMKVAGMTIAMVETGGDPGHASARCTYEKVGFKLFPTARYFQKL